MRTALRLFAVLFITVAVGIGAYGVYSAFFKTFSVRVAVASLDDPDAALLQAISETLVSGGRRTRLRLVVTGSAASSLKAVLQREADMTTARADTALPAGVSSMMAFYREVAVLGVPQSSKIEGWGDLKGKTLALTGGTDIDDPLILALLKLNGAAGVKRVAVPLLKLPSEFAKGSVQAGAFVAPLSAGGLPGQRPPPAAWTSKTTPKFLDNEDTETLASLDKRYEEATIPVGAFNASPARPSEQISTLAVRRHLIIRDNALAHFVRVAIGDLIYAKRELQGKFTELGDMGPPDLEAGALVPVQSSAKAQFNGEESGLLTQVETWLYYGPMLAGAIVSLFAWLYKFVTKGQMEASQEDTLQRFISIGIACRLDPSQETLAELRSKYSELLEGLEPELANLTDAPETVTPLLAAIDFAGKSLDRTMTMAEETQSA